jgi:hypothetical protein
MSAPLVSKRTTRKKFSYAPGGGLRLSVDRAVAAAADRGTALGGSSRENSRLNHGVRVARVNGTLRQRMANAVTMYRGVATVQVACEKAKL